MRELVKHCLREIDEDSTAEQLKQLKLEYIVARRQLNDAKNDQQAGASVPIAELKAAMMASAAPMREMGTTLGLASSLRGRDAAALLNDALTKFEQIQENFFQREVK
ncbi:hypothetical protein [Mariniblastus fucicola]|uniref:hypothetical protein n=1 Tax=Mariniblastus fucicola TaxID=980251 RepID=UPI0011E060C2|nr:hypothetical protein [Mariniblastus fucicola]